jgi:hypothetical protein
VCCGSIELIGTMLEILNMQANRAVAALACGIVCYGGRRGAVGVVVGILWVW